MDDVLVSLLNTAREQPDPLESAPGSARWWAACGITLEVKPRFDPRLAAALGSVRRWLEAAVAGNRVPGPTPPFRGEASDAVLFEVLHAARNTIAAGGLSRIRTCAYQGCARYFYDQTKNGSRRWCSLRCMERARAPRRRTIPG
jgi:hypothetical protein